MARIEIPTNPDKFIALLNAIMAKHGKDGASSPFNNMDPKVVENVKQQLGIADTNNAESARLYREAEKATQLRDKAFGQITQEGTLRHFAASARDILGGLYKGREQTLGDWGFDVAASPKAAAKSATTTTAARPTS